MAVATAKVLIITGRERTLRVSAAVRSVYSVAVVHDMDAVAMINTRGVAAIIMDCEAVTSQTLLAQFVRRWSPSVHLLLYTTLSYHGIRSACQFIAAGGHDVIVDGYDDPATHVARVLGATPRTAAAALLHYVVARLDIEHAQLRAAITNLVMRFDPTDSPSRLARSSGLSVKTIARRLEEAQLGTPGRLVVAARLAFVYDALRESVGQGPALLRTIGLSSRRPLRQQSRLALGCSLANLATLPPQDFMDRLIRYLLFGREPTAACTVTNPPSHTSGSTLYRPFESRNGIDH
jgi:hypothetical protein